VFFKSKDPGTLTNWYRDVIGLELQDWGGVVFAPEAMAAHPGAGTVFSPFEADTTYFAPSTKDFMINLASTISTAFWRAAQGTAWRRPFSRTSPTAASRTSSTRRGRRSSYGSRSRCRSDRPRSLEHIEVARSPAGRGVSFGCTARVLIA